MISSSLSNTNALISIFHVDLFVDVTMAYLPNQSACDCIRAIIY